MAHSRYLSSDEKLLIVNEFHEVSAKNKDMRVGNVKKIVAERSQRHVRTVERVLKQFNELKAQSGNNLVDFKAVTKKRPGRPCQLTDEVRKKIKEENAKSNNGLSQRALALKVNLTKSTLHNYHTRMGAKTKTQRAKPLLTARHKAARLRYVLALRDGRKSRFKSQFNVVHVDESWFFLTQEKKYVTTYPGDPLPEPERVQHKSHIKKILFITAVARPRPEDHFDGKIFLGRIQELYEAKKRSVNHQRGDLYLRDCNITAAIWYTYMVDILSEIKVKMAKFKGEEIIVQFDNAGPHTGEGNVRELNDLGSKRGWKVKFQVQPAQSPDFNINDLGFFSSLKSQVNLIKNEAKTADEFEQKIREAWRDYQPDTLERIWGVQYEVYRNTLKNRGDSDFLTPRLSRKNDDPNVDLHLDIGEYNEAKRSLA